MIALFRRGYGASPLHLVGCVAVLAVTALIVSWMADLRGATNALAWFLAAAVLHDLVFLPAYSLLDRIGRTVEGPAAGRARVPVVNHVRVPAVLCGLLFLVFFPLILGLQPSGYLGATGREPEGYLAAWVAISVGLLIASAALYALRALRARRRAGGEQLDDAGVAAGEREAPGG